MWKTKDGMFLSLFIVLYHQRVQAFWIDGKDGVDYDIFLYLKMPVIIMLKILKVSLIKSQFKK